MFVLCIIISVIFIENGLALFSDKEYENLPPVYQMDNFRDCKKQNNEYCHFDLKLNSLDPNSTSWKLIEISRRDKFLFNHDSIHRSICVPRNYNVDMVRSYGQEYVNKQVKPLNLVAKVENITCNGEEAATYTDIIIEVFLYSYWLFIIAATVYHYKISSENADKIKQSAFLLNFSALKNFKTMLRPNRHPDYIKLKSIQGLRTFTCVLIICLHNKMSYIISYLGSIQYAEEMTYKLFYYWFTFESFLVDVFFVISAFLLTIDVLRTHDSNKGFTLKNISITIINRYLRLWPVLGYAILLQRRKLPERFVPVPLPIIFDTNQRACGKNWWGMLLLIQNFFLVKDSCYVGSWYLAADFQLYGMTLLILYLTLKHKSKVFIIGSIVLSYLLFSIIIYSKDLDIILRFYTEFFKANNFFHDTNFLLVYSMTHVHSVTYFLGMCFGIIYYKYKDSSILNGKIFALFWKLSFFILPLLAVLLATKEYGRLSSAIIGPFLRPMFGFGIGMAILGMSTSNKSVVKTICENRVVEFFSNLTFSTYICHFLVVFARSVFMHEPLKWSTYTMITSMIHDLILSFLAGMLIHICVELPANNLRKLLIQRKKHE